MSTQNHLNLYQTFSHFIYITTFKEIADMVWSVGSNNTIKRKIYQSINKVEGTKAIYIDRRDRLIKREKR